MAFEAFIQPRRTSSLAKRIVFVLVATAHGAAIAAGVVYSYWHVDELTPPTLRVTFIAAAPPPPPPPPPPAGGGARPKKVAVKTPPVTPVVQPKPTDIVQPRVVKPTPVKHEFRKHDDEEVEEDDGPVGVKGGVKGGVIGGEVGGEVGGQPGGVKGGVIGGTSGGTGTAPAKLVPPNVGTSHRQNCAKPDFPVALRRKGVSYLINAKICVSAGGSVTGVSILNHVDQLLEDSIVRSEKACHYNPWLVGSTAAPFCYVEHFEFRGE